MIGKTFGDYLITQRIGSGGVGDVYAGIDQMLEREVAIKVLKPELMRQANVLSRFRSEAIILAKLSHPNIASVYAFLNEAGQSYLVMELVRGWALQQMVNVQGPLPLPVALNLIRQTLTGLSFAHQHSVIHRDIKPANVMLTHTGTIKIMDFGVARVLGSERLTRSGYLVGTPEYMSPEQICGKETDVRSDIYSLGILMYELLTGQVPFTSHSEYELMKSQVETLPPLPQALRPDTPPTVSNTIMRALSKTPEERFQSADEMALALDQYESNAIPQSHALEIQIKQLQAQAKVFIEDVHELENGSRPQAHRDQKFWNKSRDWRIICQCTLKRAFDGIFRLFENYPWLGPGILVVASLTIVGLLTFDNLDSAPGNEARKLFPQSRVRVEYPQMSNRKTVNPTEYFRPSENAKDVEEIRVVNPSLVGPDSKVRQPLRFYPIDRKEVQQESNPPRKPPRNSKDKGRSINGGSKWVIRR